MNVAVDDMNIALYEDQDDTHSPQQDNNRDDAEDNSTREMQNEIDNSHSHHSPQTQTDDLLLSEGRARMRRCKHSLCYIIYSGTCAVLCLLIFTWYLVKYLVYSGWIPFLDPRHHDEHHHPDHHHHKRSRAPIFFTNHPFLELCIEEIIEILVSACLIVETLILVVNAGSRWNGQGNSAGGSSGWDSREPSSGPHSRTVSLLASPREVDQIVPSPPNSVLVSPNSPQQANVRVNGLERIPSIEEMARYEHGHSRGAHGIAQGSSENDEKCCGSLQSFFQIFCHNLSCENLKTYLSLNKYRNKIDFSITLLCLFSILFGIQQIIYHYNHPEVDNPDKPGPHPDPNPDPEDNDKNNWVDRLFFYPIVFVRFVLIPSRLYFQFQRIISARRLRREIRQNLVDFDALNQGNGNQRNQHLTPRMNSADILSGSGHGINLNNPMNPMTINNPMTNPKILSIPQGGGGITTTLSPPLGLRSSNPQDAVQISPDLMQSQSYNSAYSELQHSGGGHSDNSHSSAYNSANSGSYSQDGQNLSNLGATGGNLSNLSGSGNQSSLSGGIPSTPGAASVSPSAPQTQPNSPSGDFFSIKLFLYVVPSFLGMFSFFVLHFSCIFPLSFFLSFLHLFQFLSVFTTWREKMEER